MIQRIVKVKGTEFLDTKDKSRTYLSAVLTDGTKESKQSIFDPELQKTIKEAEKSGASLNIGLEKEGQFWNLKTAVVTEDVVQPTTAESVAKPSARSTDQNVSIEKQVKLKTAEVLYEHCTDAGTPLNEELFLKCYRICDQAFRNDGDLISEIKKLGGKDASE